MKKIEANREQLKGNKKKRYGWKLRNIIISSCGGESKNFRNLDGVENFTHSIISSIIKKQKSSGDSPPPIYDVKTLQQPPTGETPVVLLLLVNLCIGGWYYYFHDSG